MASLSDKTNKEKRLTAHWGNVINAISAGSSRLISPLISQSHFEHMLLFFFFFFFFFFCLFRVTPEAYGDSQARGPFGAAAPDLHRSHSSARSEPCVRPTPQLTAMANLWPTEPHRGSKPNPKGYWSGS